MGNWGKGLKPWREIRSPVCRFHFSELPAVTGEDYVLSFSSRCRHLEGWSGGSRDGSKGVSSWRVYGMCF